MAAGSRMKDGECERVVRLGPSSLGTHGAVRQNGAMNPPSSASTQAEHAIDTPTSVSPAEQRFRGVRPSDLARRVTIRRNELGMSLEELAKRAGIDPVYLRYFEQSPDAHVSAGTMLLMAVALDTTPMELQGGDMDRPLGHGRAGPHPVLDTLTLEQCQAHLASGGGRANPHGDGARSGGRARELRVHRR
jgi:hypothetical protein